MICFMSFVLLLLPIVTDGSFRIVGGGFIDVTKAPWQARVYDIKFYKMCGGVIITETVLLSAAHCFPTEGPPEANIIVTVGYNISWGYPPDTIVYSAKEVFVHPQYRTGHISYDLAVVHVDKKMKFSKRAQPAKLPKRGDNVKDGMIGKVSGWGATSFAEGDVSFDLKQAVVVVVEQDFCEEFHKDRIPPGSVFCGEGEIFGDGTCVGDSGGPFVTSDKIVRGIIAFGYNCSQELGPEGYTNVHYFLDFIHEKMKAI